MKKRPVQGRLPSTGIPTAACIFLFSFCVSNFASAQVPITNATLITTWSDSFSRAQYGNRQNFFLLSHFILMHPTNRISPRDHSRSGGSNLDMETNRFPRYGLPEWGAAGGKTNVIDILYVSGNGGPNSNQIYTNFAGMALAPSQTFNANGVLTNDWPQPAGLFTKIIIGDPAYPAADGQPAVRDYDLGAQAVAAANGFLYVPSWSNTVGVVTNLFATNTAAYGWPGPHPGNELQLYWTLTSLRSLGEDSNAFTAVFDWNNATGPSQTNHCIATGLSKSGASFSFTFRADRMDLGYYTPDASQTNDCTGAFYWGISNDVCEILRITNCPAGNYCVFEDGVKILANITNARLSAGINLFTDVHSGALWNQKKECLGELCDLVDINRTNCSDAFNPDGNTLIIRQESYADSRWPTNAGVAGYIALMSDREAELQAEDAVIHANAQQTNHTFQFVLQQPLFAPFHR